MQICKVFINTANQKNTLYFSKAFFFVYFCARIFLPKNVSIEDEEGVEMIAKKRMTLYNPKIS
jgi:hypothetical protein